MLYKVEMHQNNECIEADGFDTYEEATAYFNLLKDACAGHYKPRMTTCVYIIECYDDNNECYIDSAIVR